MNLVHAVCSNQKVIVGPHARALLSKIIVMLGPYGGLHLRFGSNTITWYVFFEILTEKTHTTKQCSNQKVIVGPHA